MNDFYDLNLEAQVARLQDAALSAVEHWAIVKPKISLLKYRENAVFKLTSATEKNYILRVHRANYHSKEAIASELSWIAALKKTLNVPQIIATKEQTLFAKAFVKGDADARVIDVFDWVEGSSLADLLPHIQTQDLKLWLKKMGQAAACLHKHSSVWRIPEGFERHSWDAEGLVGERPFWGRFWELPVLTVEQKKLILKARDALRVSLQKYPKTKQSYGLIHADMIPDNLMISNDELVLIDFDDAGFGYYMFELATILHSLQEHADYEDLKAALLAGYQAFRSLSEEDLAYLEAFRLARAFSYLGWYNDRPEMLRNTARVSRAIARVVKQSEKFLS